MNNKDKNLIKDVPRGTANCEVLGDGSNPEHFAFIKRMTPTDVKREEIAADPQYQADTINRERERSTSRKRSDKDVRPL